MNPIQDPVFRAYVVSAAVLGMNLVVLANLTAVTRARHDEVVNPEDHRLNPTAAVVYDGGNDVTARYRRAHRNALENVPLFLVTGLLLALVGPPPALAYGLFAGFVVLRLLHSVAYLRQLQPWRTVTFAVSALVQVAILATLVWCTFAG
ncbi:MAG: MAPEG family protein [Myxococcota bacterium]